MKRFWLLALMFALLTPPIAASDQTFTVSGFGGYPISQKTTSLWLAGPDHRPVIMVYFCGESGWHDTQWKFNSKFQKGEPGWVELKSEKATLRLSVNVDSGEAEVQSGKFKIADNNTFLVLLGNAASSQKIIPLGVFELRPSGDQPASVLLLNLNPKLKERIDKEEIASTK